MLTKREIEVLSLKKKGLTQQGIAKKLDLSQPAVSKFYNNALRKIREAEEIVRLKKEMNLDD